MNRNKGTTVVLEQLTLSSSDDSCCIATFLGNSHMLIAVSKTEICTVYILLFVATYFASRNFYFFQLPILHKINLSRPRFEALTLLAMALLCLVLLPVVGSWCSRAKGGGACSCPLGGGE